jgi:hypothetical protein
MKSPMVQERHHRRATRRGGINPSRGHRARAAGWLGKPWLAQDTTWALGVCGVCLALYAPTLAPSVVEGDGGEFQMLAHALGVPHPTGYPLYLLLSWAATHLPVGGDVAFRVTLLGTVTAAASMGMFYLLLRELAVRRPVAALSALLLASAPRLWMHAAAAEVYPLSVLLMLLASWLLLRWGKGKARLWAVTLAFGVALTHHISIRLVAPAVLVYLLLVEPWLPLRPRRWLPALGALLLPLGLYGLIPLRASHFLSLPELQGRVVGVPKAVAAGLVSPFYLAGGTARLVLASGYSREVLSHPGLGLTVLHQYLEMIRSQVPLVVVAPLALLGLAALLRQRPRAGLYLLLAYLVNTWASLTFLALVKEDGNQFIPALVFTGVWFAYGAEVLVSWLEGRWPLGGWMHRLAVGLVAGVALYNVAWHGPEALDRCQVDTRAEAEAILRQPLPEGAVLAGHWSEVTPLRYLQRVDGLRPDLWVVHADEVGIRSVHLPKALADEIPFYVLRATPAGLRLLPLPLRDTGAISRPAALRLGGVVRWRGSDLPQGPVVPGAALPLTLYWQVEAPVDRDWMTFIHLVDERGERVAQVDRVPLENLYPPTAWQIGQWLADPYELLLPPDLPPGHYQLLFGWYSGPQRLRWEDGQDVQTLGAIQVRP